jgi:hypothetical protein
LGRWLGVSHCVGSDLCFWIVTDSGQVVLKTSVEHVTRDDYLNEDTKAKVKEFEEKLGERLDDSNFILQGEDGVNLKMLEDLDDEGIGTMMEDRITPTEEEYDDMIVDDKICMMMTRLACNRAIESSYWRMDNDSDVGLLTGYVLYRLPVELEFMDLDTFPH